MGASPSAPAAPVAPPALPKLPRQLADVDRSFVSRSVGQTGDWARFQVRNTQQRLRVRIGP
jgi:hypothetical protein